MCMFVRAIVKRWLPGGFGFAEFTLDGQPATLFFHVGTYLSAGEKINPKLGLAVAQFDTDAPVLDKQGQDLLAGQVWPRLEVMAEVVPGGKTGWRAEAWCRRTEWEAAAQWAADEYRRQLEEQLEGWLVRVA